MRIFEGLVVSESDKDFEGGLIWLTLVFCGSADPNRGAFRGDAGGRLALVADVNSEGLTRRAGVRFGSSRGRVFVKFGSAWFEPEGSAEPKRGNFVAENGISLTGTRLAGLRLDPSSGGAVNTGTPKIPPAPGTLPGRSAVGCRGTRRAGEDIRDGLAGGSEGFAPEGPASLLISCWVEKIRLRSTSSAARTGLEDACWLGEARLLGVEGNGALRKEDGRTEVEDAPDDVDGSGDTIGANRFESTVTELGESDESSLRDDALLALASGLLRDGDIVPDWSLPEEMRADRLRDVPCWASGVVSSSGGVGGVGASSVIG